MSVINDYIKEVYPYGIRKDAFDIGSITYNYDLVRSTVLDNISDNIDFAGKQLTVITSTLEGIIEWEKFLGISLANISRTLEERKADILARITGQGATLKTLKTLTYSITGGSADSITFDEKWITNPAGPDSEKFTYTITINNNLVGQDFNVNTLRSILESVQPAHCTLFIVVTDDLVDNIGVTIGVPTSALLTQFQFDTNTWSSGTDPMVGYVWG